MNMRKLHLLTVCAVFMVLAACNNKKENNPFLGSWGVEKIEYYNTDYAGNPIAASLETFNMTPGDPNNGIDLIFKADKTGEMRDRSQDTLWLDYNQTTHIYETIIICPDTTIVTPFTYSFDNGASVLYLTPEHARPYMMHISNMTDNSFVYENEYGNNYVEKAYLKRLSETKSSLSKQSAKRPIKEGTFLSGK